MKKKDDMTFGAGGKMPEPERRMERLAGLLVAGLILLNFPLLSIFSVSSFVLGIPVLYVYMFSVWAFIIGVTAIVLRRRQSEEISSSDSTDRKGH